MSDFLIYEQIRSLQEEIERYEYFLCGLQKKFPRKV
jgi:hypothetical protein